MFGESTGLKRESFQLKNNLDYNFNLEAIEGKFPGDGCDLLRVVIECFALSWQIKGFGINEVSCWNNTRNISRSCFVSQFIKTITFVYIVGLRTMGRLFIIVLSPCGERFQIFAPIWIDFSSISRLPDLLFPHEWKCTSDKLNLFCSSSYSDLKDSSDIIIHHLRSTLHVYTYTNSPSSPQGVQFCGNSIPLHLGIKISPDEWWKKYFIMEILCGLADEKTKRKHKEICVSNLT